MLLICVTAFLASGLTLFSGFGLGTILLPAFAVFFPVELAVAMTAIVHLLNNLFKLALVGCMANRRVVLRFGVPAIVAAFGGAWLLTLLSDLHPLWSYSAMGRQMEITPVKLVVAVLMIVFALLDVLPLQRRLEFSQSHLPLGGLLSGFFGGLSGHQGALRSAFLIRAGLSKDSFIATGVVIACMVDVSRLAVYSIDASFDEVRQNAVVLIAATLSAFAGAFVGARLIRKVTIRQVQALVAVLLIVIALALAAGVV